MRQARFKHIVASVLAMPVGASAAEDLTAQQPNCNKRVEIVRHLAAVYAESPVALGTASNGSVVELFHSKDGRSWTITITTPDGETCMIAAGEDWNRLPPLERILHGS